MDVLLLNKNFESIGIVDNYKSLIWTDRYDEYGDFELYIPMDSPLISLIKKGYYLWCSESEHMMIVESISITTDIEDGSYFVVTGWSLESILRRRIVWNKRVFATDTPLDEASIPKLQDVLIQLFNENLINPTLAIRKINNFVFKHSTDPKITKLTFEGEFLGEDLYEVTKKLCQENEIGFKVTFHDTYDEENNVFVFELYAGVDRSYAQDVNPYVIFSPKFNNLINSTYVDSDASLKNVTLIVGESEYGENGEEVDRRQYVLNNKYGLEDPSGLPSGLDRREIFTDATSLSTDDGYGGIMSAEMYQAMLKQKGIDTLIDNTTVTAFSGEIDYTKMYIYGEDYNIGDIVQIVNEYGLEGQVFVSEFIMSHDQNGLAMYPTFKIIQKGVYEKSDE